MYLKGDFYFLIYNYLYVRFPPERFDTNFIIRKNDIVKIRL